jgi:hypothetical protein
MKRLVVSLVFALAAGLPALADDVLFAQPPSPGPGQSNASTPSLGDIMGTTQMRHIKLWYAIKAKNWGLVKYELDQLKDSFDNAAILYRNIPIDYIASVQKPLAALREGAESKNGAKSEKAYAELTKSCNSCHEGAEIGFILIQTPTYSPFSDQKFAPAGK